MYPSVTFNWNKQNFSFTSHQPILSWCFLVNSHFLLVYSIFTGRFAIKSPYSISYIDINRHFPMIFPKFSQDFFQVFPGFFPSFPRIFPSCSHPKPPTAAQGLRTAGLFGAGYGLRPPGPAEGLGDGALRTDSPVDVMSWRDFDH